MPCSAPPECSGTAVPAIEQTRIVARKSMHQPRDCARLFRRKQQVHMVAHQHIGVQSASEAQECMAQALQVTLAIFIVQKARQPVVAPLHYVLWNAGDIVAWMSGHARQHRSRAKRTTISQAHDDQ